MLLLRLWCRERLSSKSISWFAICSILTLRAKKYDESKDLWQARLNDDWRFYFTIEQDTYVIHDVITHPK